MANFKTNPVSRQLVLLSIGCLFYASQPAHASCSATLCSVNTQPALLHTLPGLRVDLRYEYIRQDHLRSGTSAADGQVNSQDELEETSINQNLVAMLDYQSDGPWGVSLHWPLSRRQHEHMHIPSTPDPAEEESWRFTELGDLRVLGRYQWRHGSNGVQFGVKLPTGRSDLSNAMGEPAERSFQPGSGSTDLLLGAFHKHQTGPFKGFAQVLWQQPLIRQQAYQPGAKGTLDLGIHYPLTPRLNLLAQLNSQWRGRDHGSLANPVDTGGASVYISPGLNLAVSGTLQLYGFIQRQIYQHVNGVQLTAPWAATVGLSKNL